MKSGIEKLNKMTEHIYRAEMMLGILMLCVVSLIACRMPDIMERDRQEETTYKEKTIKNNGITIVVDPGHGGVDPGKIGINNVLEKDLNLTIAQKLRDKLKAEGYRVVMTRETDNGLYDQGDSNKKRTDMNRRCELINSEYKKNDKMINVSIHQNSYTSESAKGPQVFFYSKSDKSTKLANIIQNTINEEMQIEKPRTEKANDNYFMLVHTQCPSVIVECGFLSNWDDAQKLIDDMYQEQMVNSIYNGIEKFYDLQY